MKKLSFLLIILIFGVGLTACGSAQASGESVQPTTETLPTTQAPQQSPVQELTREDTQGAVTVQVTPQNLSNPDDLLTFEVTMNTHSVDLSMDLATLASLTTDDGRSVQATLWDAQLGGHHVSGMLSFPANLDGQGLLDGATKLSMTIKDVDAPERIFTWELQK